MRPVKRIATAAVAAAVATLVLAPAAALACGAFIARTEVATFNDALQFAVVRIGTTTFVTVRNQYRGPAEEFAILVPVPALLGPDDVKVLDPSVFYALEAATGPELRFEQERDPCWVPDDGDDSGGGGGGSGGGSSGGGVRIEAEFAVGEYDVVVLSASEAAGLDAWLATNKYKMPAGMAPLLAPYVAAGSKFFVAKVDPKRVTMNGGRAVLSPLRFRYDAPELTIPVRLSTANSAGEQDVIVYAIAATPMEVANRPSIYIPSGIEISEPGKADFGGFYRALFARTIEQTPDAAVTEYVREVYYNDKPVLPPLGADMNGEWTLSRIHLRVRKGGNVDDLVLRAGKPGHFRASYPYRTPWTGPIKCAKPVRGIYDAVRSGHGMGGGTGFPGHEPDGPTRPLEEMIAAPIAALGVNPRPAAKRPVPTSGAGTGGGCGCGAGDSDAAAGAAAAAAAVAMAIRNRRRRRVTSPARS